METIVKRVGRAYLATKDYYNASKKGARLANGWTVDGYKQAALIAVEEAQKEYVAWFSENRVKTKEETSGGNPQRVDTASNLDQKAYFYSNIIIYSRKLCTSIGSEDSYSVSSWNKTLQQSWNDFLRFIF